MKINNQTLLFISAALKPGNFGSSIYNRLFEVYGINAVYLPKMIHYAASLVAAVRALDIKGCSVTMPYKSQVIPYLDELDDQAEQAMSVNTIVNKSGKLMGRNTDYYGAWMVLKALQPSSVLIYGAGSVVNSLILALQDLRCPEISVYARRIEIAREIAARHRIVAIDREEVSQRHFQILINATPTSDLKDSEVFSLLDKADSLFDLVVSAHETKLCFTARKLGMLVTEGWEMSKWQLQQQFYYYTGVLPDIQRIDELIDYGYKTEGGLSQSLITRNSSYS